MDRELKDFMSDMEFILAHTQDDPAKQKSVLEMTYNKGFYRGALAGLERKEEIAKDMYDLEGGE